MRSARKQAKLSQVALAKAAGVAQSAISDLETGASRQMDDTTLIGITKNLRVRPEWLLYGEEPMRADDDDALTLLQSYHLLSSNNKAAILAAAKAMLDSQGSGSGQPGFPLSLPPSSH